MKKLNNVFYGTIIFVAFPFVWIVLAVVWLYGLMVDNF